MARQTRERDYDASDLKTLMDDAAARRAGSWREVLASLDEPDAPFPKKALTQLREDIRHLEEHGVPFTGDYRRLWTELTGKDSSDLPPPDRQVPAGADEPHAEAATTESRKTGSRVLDVLQRVESREYREMAERLEASGGAAWDHTR